MKKLSAAAAPKIIMCKVMAAKMQGFATPAPISVPFDVVHRDWEILEVDGAKVNMDGDKFCALIGENLQEGVAGFGSSASEAMHNLLHHLEIPDSPSLP